MRVKQILYLWQRNKFSFISKNNLNFKSNSESLFFMSSNSLKLVQNSRSSFCTKIQSSSSSFSENHDKIENQKNGDNENFFQTPQVSVPVPSKELENKTIETSIPLSCLLSLSPEGKGSTATPTYSVGVREEKKVNFALPVFFSQNGLHSQRENKKEFKKTQFRTDSISSLFPKVEDSNFFPSEAWKQRKNIKKGYSSYSKLQEIHEINIALASPERIRKWAEKILPNGKIMGRVTNANTLHYKTFKPQKGGLFCERIFGPLKDFECACGKKQKKTYKTPILPLQIDQKIAGATSLLAPQEDGQKEVSKMNLPSIDSIASNDSSNSLNNSIDLETKNYSISSVGLASPAFTLKRQYCPDCDVEYTWSVIRRYQLGYIQLIAPVTHIWYLKGTPSYLSLLLNIKKRDLESIIYCSESMTLEVAWNHKSILFQTPKELFLSWQKKLKTYPNIASSTSQTQKEASFNLSVPESSSLVGSNHSKILETKKHGFFEMNSSSLEAYSNISKKGFVQATNFLQKNLVSYRQRKKTLLLSRQTEWPKSSFPSDTEMQSEDKVKSFVEIKTEQTSTTLKNVRYAIPRRVKNWRVSLNETFFSNSKNESLNYHFQTKSLDKMFFHFKKKQNREFKNFPIPLYICDKFGRMSQKKAILLFIQKLWSVFYKKSYLLARRKAIQILKHAQIVRSNKSLQPSNLSDLFSLPVTSRNSKKNFFDLTSENNIESPIKQSYFNHDLLIKANEMNEILFTVSQGMQAKSDKRTKLEMSSQTLSKSKKWKSPVLPTTKGISGSIFRSKKIDKVKKDFKKYLFQSLSDWNLLKIQVSKKNSSPNFSSLFAWLAMYTHTSYATTVNQEQKPFFAFQKQDTEHMASLLGTHLSHDMLKGARPLIQSLASELANKFIKVHVRTRVAQISSGKLDYWDSLNIPVSVPQKKRPLDLPNFKLFPSLLESKNVKRKSSFFGLLRFALLKKGVKKKSFKFGKKRLLNTLFYSKAKIGSNLWLDGNSSKNKVTKPPFRESTLVKTLLGATLESVPSPSLFLLRNQWPKREGDGTDEKKGGPKSNNLFQGPSFWNKYYHFKVKNLRNYYQELALPTTPFNKMLVHSQRSFVTSKKMVNNLYVLPYTLTWKREKDWRAFSCYVTTSLDFEDVPIFEYHNRIPNLESPTFVGAGVIQILLEEFHGKELKKMDKQNRICLYEITKEIYPLKKFIRLGLADKSDELRYKELFKERDKLIRRLKLTRVLYHKKSNPMSMILSTLPVLPPDLRPIIKIDGQTAASDLNRFYQRILYRNERLQKFLKDPATRYSYEMKFTQRLLQESVDNLISNGKGKVSAEKDSRGRPLKSLSDILKGKEGRFRQHLLGKRVDYSGRSVIVVGPKLRIHECGLPVEMALELFLPFLLKRLLHFKIARTVIGAKTLLQTNPSLALEILNEVIRNHPILLNRAPTLHRLGIQAFQAKLVEGRAILLHPLVCPAFNADFDGDQMAVHVPITVEARAEAWKLMFSRTNLLSPATGDPILLPSQDMVLGCYYLTTENLQDDLKKSTKKASDYFSNVRQVLQTYYQSTFPQKLSLHSSIWLKYYDADFQKRDVFSSSNNYLFENESQNESLLEIRISLNGSYQEIYPKIQHRFEPNHQLRSRYIRTTVGRLILNLIIQDCVKDKN